MSGGFGVRGSRFGVLVPRFSVLGSGFALVAALCAGCRGHVPPANAGLAAGSLRGFNLLLVTIDTLRADHVGVYGSALGLTPTLDRFASEGLRFEVAHAHVPMTLPSHTTIMTGLYPVANGVHDNGSFRFDGAKPTLAGTLKRAGYRTGAFVGAFVLDARFGLNAGFDVYDDRVQGSSANLEIVQRPADAVLAPAADWILNRENDRQFPARQQSPINQQWFAWVHLYDPHEPYAPPEPFASRYGQDPYSGEIAYADAALGRFFDRLRGAALDRTLVVITSDHGESLGEHGERTHGLFAYEATLRVPLIVWAPAAITPAVVAAPARLVDVAPTILDLVGVSPAPADGRALRPLVTTDQPADDPGSYFEALNANLTRNWAPLKGFVRDRLKLVDLPIPELYDLAADPAEQRNLYASQRERARDLESRLDRVSAAAAASTPAPIDSDAATRLRSLGYVVSTAPRPARTFTPADDPKRLVHLDGMLDAAAASLARGDAAAAIASLQAAIDQRPDLTIAYDRLAFALRTTGRTRDALALLDRAAREGHADRALMRSLAGALRDTGDTTRALAVLEPLAREDGSDLQTLDALGQAYARAGRPRDAETAFKLVLEASPNASVTWNNLGSLYLSENRTPDALAALETAVAINPDLPGAHNGLGVVYARRGELDRAAEEWRKALALRPDLADARANLDRVTARENRR